MSGLDILAAIEARHAARARVRVDVPEWGCTLWFPEDITVAERKQVAAGLKADDEPAMVVSFILHMAETEDGAKVFEVNAVSRATLEGKGGMKVMLRIMAEVGGPETLDEAKNA